MISGVWYVITGLIVIKDKIQRCVLFYINHYDAYTLDIWCNDFRIHQWIMTKLFVLYVITCTEINCSIVHSQYYIMPM